MIFFVILHSILTITSVLSAKSNLTSQGNYKCADVYCINLDTYSKLDVPTDPIRVSYKL